MCSTEYIFDSRTSTYKLTEINTILWSWGTALYSGINFPVMIIQSSQGSKIKYSCEYNSDTKWRWLFFGDILSLVDLRHSKRANYTDFLNFGGTNFAIFSIYDLGASLGNILDIFYRLFNSQERKFALNRGNK